MDVTGGLAGEVAKLPAELRPVMEALMDRVMQAEAQSAKDAAAIADRVLAGLAPMVQQAVDGVNTLTLTVDASVQEIVGLARRIDGAKVTIALGPEPGA